MLGAILPAGLLALASLPVPATSTFLYVASYSGTITSLNLTVTAASPATGAEAGTAPAEAEAEMDICGDGAEAVVVGREAAAVAAASLQKIDTQSGLGSPAWLTLDHDNSLLYSLDEGLTKSYGSIVAYSTGPDGIMEKVGSLNTIQGPVSGVLFGAGRLAVAHYATSTVNILDVSNPSSISHVWNETFTMDGRGPVTYRQDAPHPHQAVLDPTGQYILVPDLGADLIRIFAVSADGTTVESLEPFPVAAGSGPRHISFAEAGDKKYLYLIQELSNTITGFDVAYADDGIKFTEIFSIPTHGEGQEVPTTAAAAELLVSPDSRFVTISSRGESAYTLPADTFDPPTEADVPSDTLLTYAIDPATGALDLVEKAPAGGRGPRQFILNLAGDLAAVGLQLDSRVVVMARDVETGKLGPILATADVEGDVTGVWFDE